MSPRTTIKLINLLYWYTRTYILHMTSMVFTNLLLFFIKLPPPLAISEEDVKRAEELKKEGNEFMKVEKYDEAIEKYTDAIKVDAKSAVYYCNR